MHEYTSRLSELFYDLLCLRTSGPVSMEQPLSDDPVLLKGGQLLLLCSKLPTPPCTGSVHNNHFKPVTIMARSPLYSLQGVA